MSKQCRARSDAANAASELVLHCHSYSPRKINIITKTYLYNFYPLKPHFHIVKLGFTGVYIIFLFLLKNIDCGYSLEPRLAEAVLTSTHNLCFELK